MVRAAVRIDDPPRGAGSAFKDEHSGSQGGDRHAVVSTATHRNDKGLNDGKARRLPVSRASHPHHREDIRRRRRVLLFAVRLRHDGATE